MLIQKNFQYKSRKVIKRALSVKSLMFKKDYVLKSVCLLRKADIKRQKLERTKHIQKASSIANKRKSGKSVEILKIGF